MQVIKNVVLFFLSMFLLVALLGLGAHIALSPLLTVDYYDNVLEKSGGYDFILQSFDASPFPFIKLPVSEGGTRFDGMRTLVRGFVRNTLWYLKGEVNSLDWTVELEEQVVEEMAVSSIADAPACSSADTQQLINALEQLTLEDLESVQTFDDLQTLEPLQGLEPCRPEGITEEDVALLARETGIITALTGRQEINLADYYQAEEGLAPMRRYVDYYLTAQFILIAIALVVIAFMLLTSIHKETRALYWISFTLLLAGGISVMAVSPLRDAVLALDVQLPTELISMDVNALKEAMLQPVLAKLQGYGLILLGAGVLLGLFTYLFASFFKVEKRAGEAKRKAKKDE